MTPGDVVVVDFPGVTGIKRRPAVVVSTDRYHAARPDVVLGALTSNTARANAPTDYILKDWAAAGLTRESAFRSFFVTVPAGEAVSVGRLSDQDWAAVQDRLRIALAVS
jgi:mRNA interferase MazF